MKNHTPHTHDSDGRLFTVVLALILSLISFSSYAEQLTDDKIRAFIQSMDAVQAMGPELEEFANKQENMDMSRDLSRILSSTVEAAEGHQIYDRMENLAQDHGFKNIDTWASTGDRVYNAWFAIEMGDENPDLQQEMTSAMAEIENNPNMTAAQKSQMRDVMGMAQQVSDAPAADIEAVRPHMDALREFTESQ